MKTRIQVGSKSKLEPFVEGIAKDKEIRRADSSSQNLLVLFPDELKPIFEEMLTLLHAPIEKQKAWENKNKETILSWFVQVQEQFSRDMNSAKIPFNTAKGFHFKKSGIDAQQERFIPYLLKYLSVNHSGLATNEIGDSQVYDALSSYIKDTKAQISRTQRRIEEQRIDEKTLKKIYISFNDCIEETDVEFIRKVNERKKIMLKKWGAATHLAWLFDNLFSTIPRKKEFLQSVFGKNGVCGSEKTELYKRVKRFYDTYK